MLPDIFYDYTECDEVAANLAGIPKSFSDAVRIVRLSMPDETYTIIDNTAEALCARHGVAW